MTEAVEKMPILKVPNHRMYLAMVQDTRRRYHSRSQQRIFLGTKLARLVFQGKLEDSDRSIIMRFLGELDNE